MLKKGPSMKKKKTNNFAQRALSNLSFKSIAKDE